MTPMPSKVALAGSGVGAASSKRRAMSAVPVCPVIDGDAKSVKLTLPSAPELRPLWVCPGYPGPAIQRLSTLAIPPMSYWCPARRVKLKSDDRFQEYCPDPSCANDSGPLL